MTLRKYSIAFSAKALRIAERSVGVLLQGLTMMNAPYYTQDFVKGGVLVIALVFTFALSQRKR